MRCMIKDCDVHYEQLGHGIPVINLHGFTLDSNSMMVCMEPIFRKRRGWKRIYPDLPGHGKTLGKDWIKGSDDVLQIILDFIDKIIPNTQFALVGLSYGGYLAQGIVHHRPEQVAGLLLIVPRVVSNPGNRNLPQRTILVREDEFLEKIDAKTREGFEEVSVLQTQDQWEGYWKEINSGVSVADHVFLQRLDPSIDAFSFDTETISKKFEKPTLILTGRQDHIVGYQDSWTILEKYPRATFAVLDSAGHALWMEQEDLFNSLVNEWVNRVEESTSASL